MPDMINEETIKLMKPNVVIVNTSRGALVDAQVIFLLFILQLKNASVALKSVYINLEI